MKKKVIFILVPSICLIGLAAFFIRFKILDDQSRKYFTIQETLHYDNMQFINQMVNLSAINLGEQIGVTDEDHQVYAIEGLKINEWICVRIDGDECVFRETNVPYLILDRFKANKFVVKDEGQIGGLQTIITDKTTIDKVLSDMNKENIVNMPELVDTTKQVNVYSNDFSGLCITLYYLHDEKNGNCFIFDSNEETCWKIGHELMQELM